MAIRQGIYVTIVLGFQVILLVKLRTDRALMIRGESRRNANSLAPLKFKHKEKDNGKSIIINM